MCGNCRGKVQDCGIVDSGRQWCHGGRTGVPRHREELRGRGYGAWGVETEGDASLVVVFTGMNETCQCGGMPLMLDWSWYGKSVLTKA